MIKYLKHTFLGIATTMVVIPSGIVLAVIMIGQVLQALPSC
jgi:hypothetical protein